MNCYIIKYKYDCEIDLEEAIVCMDVRSALNKFFNARKGDKFVQPKVTGIECIQDVIVIEDEGEG